MPESAPWWLPPDWLPLLLVIGGGVVISQLWKQHHRHTHGSKPPKYKTVSLSVLITGVLLFLLWWLKDAPVKRAAYMAILWAPASPILWMVFQWFIRKRAPTLATMLGENRRSRERTDIVWTDEQRREYVKDETLFGDTVVTKRNKT